MNAALLNSNCQRFHPRHMQRRGLYELARTPRSSTSAIGFRGAGDGLFGRPRVSDVECFAVQCRDGGTPLERTRGIRGAQMAQKPKTRPFGAIGFAKPAAEADQWHVSWYALQHRRRVPSPTLGVNAHGMREVLLCHNFRVRDFKKGSLIEMYGPLLAGVVPVADPRFQELSRSSASSRRWMMEMQMTFGSRLELYLPPPSSVIPAPPAT